MKKGESKEDPGRCLLNAFHFPCLGNDFEEKFIRFKTKEHEFFHLEKKTLVHMRKICEQDLYSKDEIVDFLWLVLDEYVDRTVKYQALATVLGQELREKANLFLLTALILTPQKPPLKKSQLHLVKT